MPNNPLIFYKPGLTMDAPVSVDLAAADWVAFLSWCVANDLDGVRHIFAVITQQISDTIYDQPSLKAAEARFHEPDATGLRTISEDDQRWHIDCGICHTTDDYEPQHLGELVCGHDGPRQLLYIKIFPEGRL